jgi:hypothetical protein
MAQLNRLALLIERLLDAELLPDAEGAALLAEIEAAHQSLEAGDTETARRHIKQIARFTEALVEASVLALTDGQAVIEMARRILARDAD